jgi:betaine-aldehyde dehydrogenase
MATSDLQFASADVRASVQLPPPKLFINGEWVDSVDGETFPVLDPATERPIVETAAATARDVDLAVQAAAAQLHGGSWSRSAGVERGRLLFRLADLVDRDAEIMGHLEALEVGKPAAGAVASMSGAAAQFRYCAGWADKLEGRVLPAMAPGGKARHSYISYEPVGVVGAITPWNFPVGLASWKLSAALAAGCSVVLKPSEETPLATLHLAGLIAEAGFPPGTVNVIPGFGEVAGAALVRHPLVDKVAFTGSPEVGRDVAMAGAEQYKRVTLELGGKSPQIFLADSDFEWAIPGAARAFTSNSGQVCTAGTRVLVQRDAVEGVVSGLVDAVRGIRVGDPFAGDTQMGPLISEAQLARVLGYVEKGVSEGAELATGGKRLTNPGYFVEPTVFVGNNEMTIAQDEIFGPVATVIPFDDVDGAIEIANQTRYGLAAGIWTRDLSKAHLVAAQLRAGQVYVNQWGAADPALPFGGMKMSGIGRERGFEGIRAYLEEKAVSIQL